MATTFDYPVNRGRGYIMRLLFKKKCCLCGRRTKSISWVRVNYIYHTTKWFHDDCLRDVLKEPEKYGHRKADLAIEIYDFRERAIRKELESFTLAKEKYEEWWGYE